MSISRFIYPGIRHRVYKASGLLSTHLDLFAERLFELGYAKEMGRRKIWAAVDFGRWLEKRNIAIENIGEAIIADFLAYSKRYCRTYYGHSSSLAILLKLLRELKAVSPHADKIRCHRDILEDDYLNYLTKDAGFLQSSVRRYGSLVHQFLQRQYPQNFRRFKPPSIIGIREFINIYTNDHFPRTTQLMCTALRSFLKFLFLKGHILIDVSRAVPSVAQSKLKTDLPKYLSPQQIRKILSQCDRSSSLGKRDYAILLLLARLGLRANEVSTLKLNDIDWQSGCISIRIKGGGRTHMPLPSEIGKAIVDYLKNGRPSSGSRRVFLKELAPHTGFANYASVSMIATKSIIKSGVTTSCKGSHLFRYSLATTMLRKGATLEEIGQVLNHQSQDSTRIYAKLDLDSLKKLAPPWPGGV